MSKGLEYFKKVYDEVPAWIQIMHDYEPKMLDAYTEIRGEAFKTNYLTAVEKDEIIASVNAGRCYHRSMVLHTQAGIVKGSQLEHLLEYLLVSYVYKGIEALNVAVVSIQHYLKEVHDITYEIQEYHHLIEVINDLLRVIPTENQEFLIKIKSELVESTSHHQTCEILMQAGSIPASRKQLCYVGMFLTELDGKQAEAEIIKARELGVTEEELADLGYIIILTAGIPSWFELSDHLNKKEG